MTTATPSAPGFVRVAAAVPPLRVGDIGHNLRHVLDLLRRADAEGVQAIVFPELCLTGYTVGDLFHDRLVLARAEEALAAVADATRTLAPVAVVGLPVACGSLLFNTATVVAGGAVCGVVPKTYIPGYKEFYEERWFSSARELVAGEVRLAGAVVPIGADLLFEARGPRAVTLAVEICEDLWGPLPPSSFHALAGAHVLFNPSASPDVVGKADYRRALVTQQSARAICAYVYTSSGVHESTTDVVFDGHAIVAENGVVLAESERFARGGGLLVADVDIEHLALDRARITSFSDSVHHVAGAPCRRIPLELPPWRGARLARRIDPAPFVPGADAERSRRAEEVFAIQSAGLAKRLAHARLDHVVLGLSGGLDSTLALLVALEACRALDLPSSRIHALTLPGLATSARTRGNAEALARACGVTFDTIDITAGCLQHFRDIGHDPAVEDVTFENVQARYRTMILMDRANQVGGLVLGTGDLSEIALGWNTFTGDHISHYNVNAGVPKTLVRHLVAWAAGQPRFGAIRDVLNDVLATPISPELAGEARDGGPAQRTEETIGPYDLHDFFLYHFLRWQSRPRKIRVLAGLAFEGQYDRETIDRWLHVFYRRFFASQWKRSVMPDGPKVGSVALSPRGDWRMPSDVEGDLWLADLDDGGE